VTAKPRFLAAGGRQGDGHGYASHPAFGMRGEPECVGPAILDSYAESARFYESVRHRQAVEAARLARPLLAAEDRIRDAERRAKAAHIDLRSEFRLLRDMVGRDRRGGRSPSAKALGRIERVECRLDGLPAE
jgi:hypothetical protein